jgi:hypothetical protein
MRKNMSFAIAAAILGLTIVFWAGSGVVASSANVRPHVGTASYAVTSTPYLPFQVVEPNY